MSVDVQIAHAVPADLRDRIVATEQGHWWHRGMSSIGEAILAPYIERGGAVLDAGCGAGGLLRTLLDGGTFTSAAGVDIAGSTLALARERVPEADLHVAPLIELPFEDASFNLVTSTDVLQHVDEYELHPSLLELRRVLTDDGVLFVRTNGVPRIVSERSDWRAFDRTSLGESLAAAGFECRRLTYANSAFSLLGSAIGRTPNPASDPEHGLHELRGGRIRTALGLRMLEAEARYLRKPGRSLRYGHTLFAIAAPAAA